MVREVLGKKADRQAPCRFLPLCFGGQPPELVCHLGKLCYIGVDLIPANTHNCMSMILLLELPVECQPVQVWCNPIYIIRKVAC
jgi:hypothetical protein